MGLIKRFKASPEDAGLIALIRFYFGVRPKPKNLYLYHRALRHKTLAKELGKKSNERLEFLGDAVLDAVVAFYLYDFYPNKDEGFLSQMKSKIVSRNYLNQIGEKMNLADLIQTGMQLKEIPPSLLGNAFEALIGSIYLDKGYEKTKAILMEHFFPLFVDLRKLERAEHDFKSKLLIWGQQNKRKVQFKLMNSRGDNPVDHYEVQIRVDGKPMGEGKAPSKKKAEQMAAEITWKEFLRLEQ